jgi:hypothetical protein
MVDVAEQHGLASLGLELAGKSTRTPAIQVEPRVQAM